MDVLAREDGGTDLLVQPFKAGCEVHGVAERRIVHALGRSDIADDGFADVNPEPREKRRQAFGFEFGVQPLAGGLGCKRRPASARDMVRLWIGSVPEYHDRVADEFVDRAAFGEERFRQRGEIP